MKIIHLSDLHLGKRVHEFSMLDDQRYILKQILEHVAEEHPDAVILAGDIYDKPVPPAEAVQLFDQFLCGLAEQGVEVMIISGNHDSAERIAFGGKLMEHSGVHVSPVYDGDVKPVELEDAYGIVQFFLLPFIKPIHVRRCYAEEEIESYADAMRTAISHMERNADARQVLVTHQFVTGAERSDSEEISVGGTDNVDVTVFDGFDYVALGHIHKPQWVKSGKIRYSGSLMKYSFSESLQNKSVTLLDWKAKDDLTVTTIPLQPEQDMRVIQGKLEDLLEHAEPSEDWIRAELTDRELIPYALERLRMFYPNVMELVYLYQEEQIAASNTEVKLVPEQSLVELLGGFLDSVYQYQLEEEPEAYQLMEEICKEAEQEK